MSKAARNNILRKVREALIHQTPMPYPKSEGTESVFHPPAQDQVVQFAEQFTALQGKFLYCADEQELADHFNKLCYQLRLNSLQSRIATYFEMNLFRSRRKRMIPPTQI